jgi:glycyl-tRNA synthetase alpha chain
LERLTSYLANLEDIWSIEWAPGVSYRDLFQRVEWEQATYSFEMSDPKLLLELFNQYELEAGRLLRQGVLRPGYEFLVKASHVFNTLDARGVISVTERQAYIGRQRKLAHLAAEVYLDQISPSEVASS